MSKYAFAGPLAQGKADALRQFSAEITGPRKDEHADYLCRYNVIKEFGWIQSTPMGDMYVIYLEAETDYLEENAKFVQSACDFDIWFAKTAGDILGIDYSKPLSPTFEEVVYDWRDTTATGTFKPLALVSQVKPGKTEAVRQFAEAIKGSKSADMAAFNIRYDMEAETWFLEHTPQGDVWVYYIEAVDPMAMLHEFGQSQHPFDVWLKQTLQDINGIDYSQPVQAPELVLAAQVTEAAAARI